mmetsp:Transcript_3034/g.9188  ORF Transcript_3034/g.9188 Transcript_3034/m.9188 type:complete len:263 (-) Transcript_3034:424-1212(-)
MWAEAGRQGQVDHLQESGLGELGHLQERRLWGRPGRRVYWREYRVRAGHRPHQQEDPGGLQGIHQVAHGRCRVPLLALGLRPRLRCLVPGAVRPLRGLALRGGRVLAWGCAGVEELHHCHQGPIGSVRLSGVLHAQECHPLQRLQRLELWGQAPGDHGMRPGPERDIHREPRHLPLGRRGWQVRRQQPGVPSVCLLVDALRHPLHLLERLGRPRRRRQQAAEGLVPDPQEHRRARHLAREHFGVPGRALRREHRGQPRVNRV